MDENQKQKAKANYERALAIREQKRQQAFELQGTPPVTSYATPNATSLQSKIHQRKALLCIVCRRRLNPNPSEEEFSYICSGKKYADCQYTCSALKADLPEVKLEYVDTDRFALKGSALQRLQMSTCPSQKSQGDAKEGYKFSLLDYDAIKQWLSNQDWLRLVPLREHSKYRIGKAPLL